MIDGSSPINVTRFRAKIRDFLRRSAPLTKADLAEFERMLSESGNSMTQR